MSEDQPDHAAASPAPPVDGRAAKSGRELATRIASALLLAAIASALLYAGPIPFGVLVLVVCLAMSWEWGHVVRQTATFDSVLIVHGIAVAGAIVLACLGFPALALILLIVATTIVATLRFGEHARLSAIGVLYVGLPAVALVTLRSGTNHGFLAVLYVIVAVVVTDTFAYFVGRAVGGPKLWPSVSPNKTWSGFIGGVGAAAIAGACFGSAIAGASPQRLALIALALGISAQAGDLAESALKRGYGVKDASALIPGHGGFMDRMDGLVFAAVIAALIGGFANVYAPARALLLGF